MKHNTNMQTVTIAIPAHNEARNIENLLTEVLAQKFDTFKLEHILVYCDGCTDTTVEIVSRLAKKYPKIQVEISRQRKGKSATLNAIFATISSTICVLLDADIQLANTHTIARLLAPFSNRKVGLVSGNDTPYPEKTLFGKTAHAAHELWYTIRKNVNHGDTIHNVHGPIYALRNNVYTHTRISHSITVDDHYVYMKNQELGFDHVHSPDAQIYFKLPTTISEYLRQHSRYVGSSALMSKYFAHATTQTFQISIITKIQAILLFGLRNPIFVLPALLLQIFLRLYMRMYKNSSVSGTWDPARSTKQKQKS